MREVAAIGVGIHKFGRFPDKDFMEIGRIATVNALEDAGVDWREIETVFCGNSFLGMASGQNILAHVGLTGIPIVNVENACASGGSAFRLAYQSVATGLYDMVLALGVEKMPRGFILGTQYEMWQRLAGLGVNPMFWALRARRHMRDYGLTREQLARVSFKNHKNGVNNPYAMYRRECTMEEILNSRMVCDPLTLLMMCAPNEGGAAAVLCTRDKAKQYTTKPVIVGGASLKSRLYATAHTAGIPLATTRMRNPEVTTTAAREAYEASGYGPEDLDLVELQDTSSWNEIEAYEDLGLCPEGEGGRLIEDGDTEMGGRIPCSASGGLLSKGEPIGASAMGQVVEIVWQLRGEAGPRQVDNARIGLCHTVGASGNCSVIILKK